MGTGFFITESRVKLMSRIKGDESVENTRVRSSEISIYGSLVSGADY